MRAGAGSEVRLRTWAVFERPGRYVVAEAAALKDLRGRASFVVANDRLLDSTQRLLGAVDEDSQTTFRGDQVDLAAEGELDLPVVEHVIVDGGAVVDLDPGRDLDP